MIKEYIVLNIIVKNYASATFYKKPHEGIIYSHSLDKRSERITSLVVKIDIINLKSNKEHIESIKTTTLKNNKK